ncbi:FAD-dependent oxidoreductase [Lachnospiraceae bacterium 54-53]
MAEKVVIIGGTAAGLSAASKAKRLNPGLEIRVFEKSGYISYGACGLPYFVGGLIEEPERLISLTVEQMREKRDIPAYTHHEVIKISREEKKVLVKNLDDGTVNWHAYDKLVIATGARPIKPDIEGIDAKGIHYLRTVEDGIRLKHTLLEAEGESKSVIAGGGFIGLETAAEIAGTGTEVTLLESGSRLLPFLEESFSQQLLDTLRDHGVRVLLGEALERIESENGYAAAAVTDKGKALKADLILISAGVRPNTELAEEAGIELGVRKAIRVTDYMETSDPSIWACGDCAEARHIITGKPVYIPLGTTANKQGRTAGDNLAGRRESFAGVLGSVVTKVFDQYIACTGLTGEQAEEEGYEVESVSITKADKASYYPGAGENRIRLLFDRITGKLLGAQAMGSESVAGRINVLAAAITAGMTVEEVSQLDLVYAPPVAPVYDPILIAASQAVKKVKK